MSATLAPWRTQSATFALALAASLSSVSWLAYAPPAHAQEGGGEIDALDAAARAIFEDGRRAFEAGDFETALARFQNAYEISHRPLLLWNIATTLDRLRRDEDALDMFQQYLDAVPEAANRVEVLGRMRSLREAVDARHAERDAAEAERLAREAEAARLAEERAALERERAAAAGGTETSSGSGGITPIVMIVAGGLTAVSAGVLIWSGVDTLAANDNYTTYTNAPGAEVPRATELYNSADGAQLRTNVLVGITAGLAATTAILAIFTDWDGDPPPAAAPRDAESDGGGDPPAAAAPASVSLIPTFEAGPLGGSIGLRGSF